MNQPTNRAGIRAEVDRIGSMVSEIIENGSDEELVNLVQTELSELKAASEKLLSIGEESLTALISTNQKQWREYRTLLRTTSSFLEPFL